MVHEKGHVPTNITMIFQMSSRFDRFTSQLRRGMALNAHERLALAQLWDKGPQSMSDLGQVIPLSRAAVTTLVDRLEQAGFVERSSDINDRRRTMVSATPIAIEGVDRLIAPWRDEVNGFIEELGEAEWKRVVSVMEQIGQLQEKYTKILSEKSDQEIARITRVGWDGMHQ